MRSLRPNPALARVLVVPAVLVLSLTCLPGAALCVGTGGHLAIEAVGSECVPLLGSTERTPGADALAAGSLHGCTDTPLGAPSLHGPADPGRALHGAVARVVTGAVPDDARTRAALAPRAAPRAPAWQTRSTVLLL